MLWNAAIAAAIVVAGHILGTWLSGISRGQLARTGMDPDVRRLLAKTVWGLTLTVAIIAALSFIGIDPTSLVAVVGAATLAIGMALKSTLSNVASGAMLLTLRPFRTGDVIEAAGRVGKVDALDLYLTTLLTPDGTVVTLPNDLVLNSPIVNLTREGVRRADVQWVIAADGKTAGKALEVLAAVLEANDRVAAEPAPAVAVLQQGMGGIVLQGRGWVVAADLGAAKSELLTAGVEALAKAKIPLAQWTPTL